MWRCALRKGLFLQSSQMHKLRNIWPQGRLLQTQSKAKALSTQSPPNISLGRRSLHCHVTRYPSATPICHYSIKQPANSIPNRHRLRHHYHIQIILETDRCTQTVANYKRGIRRFKQPDAVRRPVLANSELQRHIRTRYYFRW